MNTLNICFSSSGPNIHVRAYSIPMTMASVVHQSIRRQSFVFQHFQISSSLKPIGHAGSKVCSNGPGHMTNMTTTLTYISIKM